MGIYSLFIHWETVWVSKCNFGDTVQVLFDVCVCVFVWRTPVSAEREGWCLKGRNSRGDDLMRDGQISGQIDGDRDRERDRLRGLEEQRCCSVALGHDTLQTHTYTLCIGSWRQVAVREQQQKYSEVKGTLHDWGGPWDHLVAIGHKVCHTLCSQLNDFFSIKWKPTQIKVEARAKVSEAEEATGCYLQKSSELSL